MKRLKLLCVAIMITGYAEAQNLKQTQVPVAVLSAFNKLYANVKAPDWSMENGSYEAEYKIDRVENSVIFDKSGILLQTEKSIETTALPGGVISYITQNYGSTKIKEAAEISNAIGVITYEAELKHVDLIFDAKGNLIQLEKD